MIRTLIFTGFACLVVFSGAIAVAKDILTPADAERLGLVESWHRQVGAIGGARSIADIQLWVQKSVKHDFIEVFTKGGANGGAISERIAINQKDLMGRPIGKSEAERMGKMSVIRLKRRGIEADIRAVTVDQVRLYVLTTDGGLTGYDAESGEQLWSVRLGRPDLGYGTLGINDQFVTVINGSTMHQVSAMDLTNVNEDGSSSILPAGRPVVSTRIDGVPLHGAVNSRGHALVTTTRRGMETYLLGQPTVEPGFEMFSGKAITKPATFPNSDRVMWPTDSGFVYVVETSGQPSAIFRLAIDGTAEGGVSAASNDRYFFGTTGGRVYGVNATRTGEVLWNQSLGEPFYRTPFVTGEQVLVSSGFGHLHSLDTKNGEPTWPAPATDIEQIFSHVGNRLIGRDREHHLVIIDAATGNVIRRARDLAVETVVVNQDTDRFYLVGNGGMVQCLRPSDSELPTFLRAISLQPVTEDKSASEKKTAADQPAQPAADPFGAGEAKPAADPFGGPDPFGGDAAPAADPFGGGNMADPFGN